MRLVLFGNNERGVVCLEAVVEAGFDVAGVVALPDDLQPEWSRNVAQIGRALGVPTLQFEDANSADAVRRVRALEPDVIVLAGYNKMLKRAMIETAKDRCINLHASPLPSYRGAAPLNWMLIRGEKTGGISILEVDEGVDTGDILAQRFFPIRESDDYASLLRITLELYPTMLKETLERLRGGSISGSPQDPREGSFFTKRFPDDGRIEWNRLSAQEVHNLIRALVIPMPGAFTQFDDRRIIVEGSKPITRIYEGVPGRIAARWPSGVIVICADRGLLVTKCRSALGAVVPAPRVLPATGSTLG